MKLRLFLWISLLSLATALSAQSVDRDEFSDILSKTINFINYSGTYTQTDTLDQITGIGSSLAQGLARDKSGTVSVGDRYSVIHVLGKPEEKGKPADILVLLPNAGVDHIDNVRRIVSAYLAAMYGYAKPDADILAVFITIYNAVYRGNLTFFESRYKASVMKYLSADKVGLALKYTDWPGKTQLVIPLSLVAADKNGTSLAAVSAVTLVTPSVIETVRDKPNSGTTERQKLSNLMDRSVDQEQNAIDQKKAQLTAELAANQKRQQEIDAQLAASKAAQDKAAAAKASSSTPAPAKSATAEKTATAADKTITDSKAAVPTDNTTANNPVATDTKALTDEKAKLVTSEQQIKADTKQLEARQAENKDTAQASQDLRSSTAADLKNQGQATAVAASPTIVLKARLENGLILSQPQRIIIGSSEILQQSPVTNLIGHRLVPFGDGLLGLALDGNSAKLMLLSTTDLTVLKKGSTIISPYSDLVLLPGNTECLAVVQDAGDWYLGAFDLQLNLVKLKRSAIAVDPVGAITVNGDKVLVQKKDGRFTNLDLADLRLSK